MTTETTESSTSSSTEKPASGDTVSFRMGAAVGAPYSEQSTFRRGAVLQNRFKILRFIAKGGAGEVYEAHDLELRCPVALKVSRPEICDNENAIERFRREIALARQVTHPNVCRIFDVFRQEIPSSRPGGSPRETLFLTMELLNGESLASRIHRLGPMEREEALPLIEGMIAGLNAAHRVGVIHRDFKSANVVLVEELEGTRAVITDFGLARGHIPDPGAEDITMSGTVVGTPNYMSPEQLTGGDITPQTDMYALGIVIYEMMTGKRPFTGETDLSTAVKRLTEAPASPRLHAPNLESIWENTILRCLERDPEDRFPTLSDIPKALSGHSQATQVPSLQRESRRRFAWIAAIVLPVAAALLLLFSIARGGEDGTSFGLGEVASARVALLDLRNLSGAPEGAWLTTGIPEMIAGELATSGDLELIPPENVRATVETMAVQAGTGLASETVGALRDALGAELLVEGGFVRLPDGNLRVQLRVHDPQGAILTVTEQGTEDQIFDVIARLGERIRREASPHAGRARGEPARPLTAPDAATGLPAATTPLDSAEETVASDS